MPKSMHERLDLAHEEPFALGSLWLEPSSRLVRNGGSSRIIEPRVMRLLVALHSASGSVLSRDDLMESCWGGVVVGENAIQRAVSQARTIAATIGSESFAIETVRGVGYRLLESGEADPSATRADGGMPATARMPLSRRSSLLLLGGGAIAAAAAVPIFRVAEKDEGASQAARELFARAQVALRDEAYGSSGQAIALLKDAVADSPLFARAWGELALAYWESLYGTEGDGADRIGSLAVSAARRSLAIDPDIVTGRAALVLTGSTFRERDRMREGLEELAESKDRHWLVFRVLAALAADVGDWASAIQHYRTALAVQPLLPRVQVELARALWAAGRPIDADLVLDEAVRQWPRDYGVWEFKFRYLALTGNHADAASFVSDFSKQPLGLGPKAIDKRLKLLDVLDGKGGRDLVIRTYLDEVKSSPVNIARVTPVFAMLDAKEHILEMLRGYFFARGPYGIKLSSYARRPTFFLYLPPVLKLHSEPRFAQIMKAIGLTPNA